MNTPIANSNLYLHKAQKAAGAFFELEDLQIDRYQKMQSYFLKYEDLFAIRAGSKVFLMVMPFFHLASAVQEGIVLRPVAEELARGSVPAFWLGYVGLLVTLYVYGCSLLVGHAIKSVRFVPDDIVPNKFSIEGRSNLLFGIFWIVVYFALLFFFVSAAAKLPGDNAVFTRSLLIFGLLELVFGYHALRGYEYWIAWLKLGWFRLKFSGGQKKLMRLSKSCSHNYRYFLQTCTLQEDAGHRFQIDKSALEKIHIVVAYYEQYRGGISRFRKLPA